MTARIQTPFLPLYDERNACYRAVIEVVDNASTYQYYCALDGIDVMSGNDIYDGLKDQALFQHRALTERHVIPEKIAA